MKCKLCLQEKELLKKSHIVPKFLYEDMFGEPHRLVSLRLINGILTPNKILSQDCLYEPGLFCNDCDNGIINQRYEQYFFNTIFSPIKTVSKTFPRPDYLDIHEFTADYDRIKLFVLSILWRYSVLQRPENPPTYLGDHQDNLRKMIFENDPKSPEDYPFCLFCSLNKDSEYETNWSSGPLLITVNNTHPYEIFLPGFVLLIWLEGFSSGSPLPYIGKDKVLVGFSSGAIERLRINYFTSKIDFNSIMKFLKKE